MCSAVSSDRFFWNGYANRPAEAMYAVATIDHTGQQLDGSSGEYELTFDQPPPATRPEPRFNFVAHVRHPQNGARGHVRHVRTAREALAGSKTPILWRTCAIRPIR